jgi:hypothetical protein
MPPALPDVVLNAIVNAYYSKVVGEAEVARSRALSGYTIAAAIAAALTAAGLLSDLGGHSLTVQIVGCLALAAWLGSALLFLHAITNPADPIGADSAKTSSPAAFVTVVIDRVKEERSKVVDRTERAIRLVFVAVALTVAAIVLGVTVERDDGHDVTGRVVLTSSGRSAVASACGTTTNSVTATMDEHALDKATVKLTLPSGCRGQRPATLLLPKSAVAGFVVGG